MADTFKVSGSISNGSSTTITPPAGECWIVGNGSVNTPNQSLQFGGLGGASGAVAGNVFPLYGPYKPFIPVTSTQPLKLVNTSGSSQPYFITGDITTLADEGIADILTYSVDDLMTDADVAGTAPVAGKALYMCYLAKGTNGTTRLVDATSGTTLLSNMQAYYASHAHYWLWSGLNVKVQIATSTVTDVCARMAQYVEDAMLDEYTNRIAIRQTIAASGTYDLRPPAGEIWYVDLHNWHAGSLNLLWNGVTSVQSTTTNPIAVMRLSHDNWVRFQNAGGVSAELIVSGTKASVV